MPRVTTHSIVALGGGGGAGVHARTIDQWSTWSWP